MNWKSFSRRIVLVAVAFPVLGAAIFAVPHLHHLAFNVIVTLASMAGAMETAGLFRARRVPTSTVLAPLMAGLFPAGTWLEISGIIGPDWLGVAIVAGLGVLIARGVIFQPRARLSAVLASASSSIFSFLYPGLFLSFITRLTALPEPSLSVLYFLCLVFGNDMAAYFAGSMWGAGTRLDLPVSPQKSAVGFAAGLAGSLIILGIFRLAVPWYFAPGLGRSAGVALATGVLVIAGDLLESGLKRSARVKDSGVIIPGRGGLLDSVDSMVLSAPLFYYAVLLLGA